MNNDEIDLHEFARLFDAALSSNNPTVKKALRNFMLVASIVEAENSDQGAAGPLITLLNRVESLEKNLADIRNQLEIEKLNKSYSQESFKRNYTTTWPDIYYSSQTQIDNSALDRLIKGLGSADE